MHDVYDGRIWSEFQTIGTRSFLSLRHSIAFMLNVDWFNPFILSQYSAGAIYLSIMNLPRNLRFKRENIILVGLLPGPDEQRHDVNSFLTPIVDELLQIWDGVQMMVMEGGQKISCTIYGALLCVACDICLQAERFVDFCHILQHLAVHNA